MKRRRSGYLPVIAGVLLAGGCVAACIWFTDNRVANFERRAEIYVHPGEDISSVKEDIFSLAGVKRKGSLERMFRNYDAGHRMKVGHYTVEPGNTSAYVARMLVKGWQTPVRMTLSGTIRRTSDIARKVSRQMLADSASVHEALKDSGLYIVPDTYEMYWTSTADEIVSRLRREYDAFWTDGRRQKAGALNLTPAEVQILASIVNGETNCVAEMPKVAGVYLNRLARGQKLEADPTVAYCYDYKVTRILNHMLKCDSPYNTYRHAGLPPGPICVPSKAAVDAVLDPDFGNGAVKAGGKGCNIYFCADPSLNGTHRFTASYQTHLANAAAFRRAVAAARRNR